MSPRSGRQHKPGAQAPGSEPPITLGPAKRARRSEPWAVKQLRNYFELKRWRQAQLQKIAVRRPIEYDSRMYSELILTGRQRNCSRPKINLGHDVKLVGRKINQRFIRAPQRSPFQIRIWATRGRLPPVARVYPAATTDITQTALSRSFASSYSALIPRP